MAYKSRAQLRKARLDKAGAALIAACALTLAAMIYGAYSIDKARGVSVSQSLQSAGL